MEHLAGKVAVITGGASGIGLAMARRFGAAGMALVIADIEPGPLDAAEAALRGEGLEVLAVQTDVADPFQVNALAAAALERFGIVNVVCNNAGVGGGGGILETSLEDWHWVLGVNLYGVVHGLRAFLPHMIEHGDGHVVNTASVTGLVSTPGMADYNVSKHGVVTLSETLFYELEMMSSTIGVTVVCPAWVRTRIADSDRNRPGGRAELGPIGQRLRDTVAGLTEGGRSPEEVAEQVHDAVIENRFYVLTHKGMLPFIKARHDDIADLPNPSVEQGV